MQARIAARFCCGLIRGIDGENMSQRASFLTDFLFPGLLIACGCLGLGVVNAIGHGKGAPRQKGTRVGKGSPPKPMTPARARPVEAVRPTTRVGSRNAPPRVAPLRRVSEPTQHRLGFGKRQLRVSDVERERLRVFLAAAKPGPESRIKVVAQGVGRRGKRRARKRAEGVAAILRQLGVAAVTIADPQVVSDNGGTDGSAVTIVIGKR